MNKEIQAYNKKLGKVDKAPSKQWRCSQKLNYIDLPMQMN